MKIGKTIKKLRLEKEMTQEILAEKLSVSVSAVSQWEMGKTMPDISMIPLLVSIFDVTADELLGINGEEADRRVAEYIQKANEYYHAWKHGEMVELMEKAYEEFPANLDVISQYAFALNATMSEHPEKTEKCIELNKKILDRSVDDKQRFRAIYNICSCYAKSGDKESATFYAKKLPVGPHMCKSNVMRQYGLLPNEEKISAYQFEIGTYVWLFGEYVNDIADPNYTNPCCKFSVEQRVQILEQMINVIKAIYGDNPCDMNNNLYEYHRIIGALWLFGKQPEKAIDYFEKAYEYALAFKESYNEGDCYTSPLMNGCEARPHSDWNKGKNTALSDLLWRFTNQERYKVLEINERFNALKEKLKQQL